MENMAATAEAEEMAEKADMAEKREMVVERAAIVEAEAVKIGAVAAISKIKVARIPNPAIRPLAPSTISVMDPIKPRNAQTMGLVARHHKCSPGFDRTQRPALAA